jgi:uncharacterized C2H2 Zn-finger protein
MSSFKCPRCPQEFKYEKKLRAHLRNDIPCDFICNKCGNQMYTKSSYYKHVRSNCDFIQPYKDPGDQIVSGEIVPVEKTKKANKPSQKRSTHIHGNQNNTSTNISGDMNITNQININIEKLVITPHTQEMKIDKEQLLGDIVEKILFRMDTGISGKANWGTMAFTDSFHQMFAHIYGNSMKPEYQNLLLKDETTRELQVFNGETFVDDKLTSEERMLKVLHFIGDGLRWMVENCDNYTEEEKEEKRDKIGRVLSGIPRFKMTYKAMFDNIFNTLRDVREQILERIEENNEIKMLTQ